METDYSTTGRARPLEVLYEQTAPAALRLAYFLTGEREAAEDLVQEAFVRVAARLQHLRTPDNLPAYLRTTIINLFMSQLRHRRVEREWIRRQPRIVPIVEPHDASGDELWHALALLPERQRAAVVLRYYEDLSEREAAEVMGCSTRALNQLVVRAMSTLRQHIRRDDA